MNKWTKVIIFVEVLWVLLLVTCCAAVVQVITARAETKTIINGQYVDIDEAPPINQVSKALDEQDANGHQLEYLGKFFITYYCSCIKCNGSNAGIDGFGNPLEWGCVAVDRKVIPMHTKLVIDGYDTIFEARDTGSGINGHDIDIYVPVSHSEALAMCKDQWLNVWRYKEK